MKEIELNRGKIALVDDADYEWLSQYKWSTLQVRHLCYAQRSFKAGDKTKSITMHRFITDCPPKMIIDHIDGNGLNNQRSNLRIVTRRQNQQNRHENKTSIYPGVNWNFKRNKWEAGIRINGKTKHLGYFDFELEAFKIYYDMVLVLGEEILDFPYPAITTGK